MAKKKNNISKRHHKRRKLKKGVLFFFLFLLAVLIGLSLTVFFPVAAIRVQGTSIYTQEQIIAASGIKEGDNLFLPLFNGSKNRIKSTLPYIKNVSYGYALPGTIILTVTPYTAELQFKTKGTYVIAAKDGTVLETAAAPREDLPLVIVNGLKYKVHETVDFNNDDVSETFASLQEIAEELQYPLDTVDLTDPLNIQLQIRQTTVELGSAVNLEKKMHMVEKMLQNVPDGEKGTIDISAWTPENKQASYMKDEEA